MRLELNQSNDWDTRGSVDLFEWFKTIILSRRTVTQHELYLGKQDREGHVSYTKTNKIQEDLC